METKIDFKVGDLVKLPFNETGKIVEIKNLLWGFNYIVKMRKVNPLFDNKTNQKIDFKLEQLEQL
jgi:uncharacterized membrane protein